MGIPDWLLFPANSVSSGPVCLQFFAEHYSELSLIGVALLLLQLFIPYAKNINYGRFPRYWF